MTDALFWYGCNMTRHAEIIRLGTQMLAAVGVAAAPTGGPSACCGSPKESTPRIAEGMANRTMQRFNQSGAGQVITWCPTCHMNLDDFTAKCKHPVTASRNNQKMSLFKAKLELAGYTVNERRTIIVPAPP